MRLTATLLAVILAAGVLAACGTPGADLFVVERSGSIPGAKLTLRVTDDGFVECNGGAKREITSDQLITARDIARELAKPAERRLSRSPKPGSVLRYSVRLEAGVVKFSDNSRPQPTIFFRTAAFTRELARGVCGLPR